jgi:glycerol-3-phosphate O-acyltransferase
MAQDSSATLLRFNRQRHEIIDEVVERVTRGSISRAWMDPSHGLDYLLNEAAFMELSRLEESPGNRPPPELAFWRDVAHRAGRASEEENAEKLQTIVTRYTRDIAGHFRAGVYEFATRVLPTGISLVFSKQSPADWLSLQSRFDALRRKVNIEGEVGKLRQLAKVRTVMFVPNHTSHIDSMLMGWALNECGLPPVTYGAEKNLFNNILTSFFMQNLGAYKVDRRRRHTIYKSVLKEYSQVLIERGFHSLFFPGGTRSRSGQIESHLKLGLLGTGLAAYSANVRSSRAQSGVVIVPVNISYSLVLEAQTLISEFLKPPGQARYIIDDDEFSSPGRVMNYLTAMMELDHPVTVRFGTPMDVFGNRVDLDGESMDQQGRRVDPSRYLWINGVPEVDRDRDREYTRQLGASVSDAFRTGNVVHPIHILAFALFEHLRRQHRSWDLERTLRFASGDTISLAVAEGETERLLRIVRRMADEALLRLNRPARSLSARAMIDEGMRQFGLFHHHRIAEAENGQIRLLNLPLLYYYSNQLRGYELERRLMSPGGYR